MKRNVLAIAILAATCSAPAMAREFNGWAYNGSTGWAFVDEPGLSDTQIASSTNLGYRWGTFGIEGGYTFFNDFEDKVDVGSTRIKTDLDVNGWTLGVNAHADLSDRWSVQARGGAFFWDGDAHIDVGSTRVAVADDGTDWYAGVSLDYDFSRRASMGIAYTYYSLGGGPGFDGDLHLVGFHSEFRF